MSFKKRGLIFALDAALAVTIVVIMVINSSYYFSTASRSSLAHLQLVNLGNDIITILDYADAVDEVVYNASTVQTDIYEIPEELFNISKFLPANYEMWASISDLKETPINRLVPPGPLTIPATTLLLERRITTSVELNITMVGAGTTLTITLAGSPPKSIFVNQNTTYIVGKFPFKKGPNTLDIKAANANRVFLNWMRVLGTEVYAGSTDEAMTFPTDKFIGSGERIVTVKKKNASPRENPIEGTHIVRYKIWLKGES